MLVDPKFKFSGIYAIINIHNGRTYIGSAVNIYTRWRSHIDKFNVMGHANIYLQDAFNKNGLEGLVFTVIEKIEDKTKLIEREQFYMERFKSIVPNGYNILPVAGSRLGTKASNETKEKLKIARNKRITKDETRLKIGLAHKNRVMTNIHKERLSLAAKGKLKSDAHKQSLKEAWAKRKAKKDEELFKNMVVINANI